eukprot:COSAG06_NODE_2007_length_7858_cov_23.947158_6_plen_67_part_00
MATSVSYLHLLSHHTPRATAAALETLREAAKLRATCIFVADDSRPLPSCNLVGNTTRRFRLYVRCY